MKFLFVFNAATPVEPVPIHESRTMSPSFEKVFIRYSSNFTGFSVGCVLFFVTVLKLIMFIGCLSLYTL